MKKQTHQDDFLREDFYKAHEDSLFDQKTLAIVAIKSESWCERKRWDGTGVPFMKIGNRCLYRKRDILAWINQHGIVYSTSAYQQGGPQ